MVDTRGQHVHWLEMLKILFRGCIWGIFRQYSQCLLLHFCCTGMIALGFSCIFREFTERLEAALLAWIFSLWKPQFGCLCVSWEKISVLSRYAVLQHEQGQDADVSWDWCEGLRKNWNGLHVAGQGQALWENCMRQRLDNTSLD